MTGTTLSLTSTTSTNAAFRAWGLAVSGALATCGMVKTADTGQIDWTTVAAPGAGSTFMGYEIWRFNDSLQATRPIYFKLRYGSGTNSGTPQLELTVGTGSDGAGTLTSVAGFGTTVSTASSLFGGADALAATTSNCFFGGVDGSGIGVMLWPATGSSWGGMMFAIERTRDITGTANGDGFYWIRAYSGSSTGNLIWQQFVFTSGFTQQTSINNVPVVNAPVPAGTTMTIGTTLYPSPMFTGWTPKLQAPSLLLVALRGGDLTGASTFAMTHYGTSRTWVAAGSGGGAAAVWGTWTLNTGVSNGPNSFAMNIS